MVADAVNAKNGIVGKHSLSLDIFKYAGLKSCPHCEIQCASSMAIKFIGRFFMRSKIQSLCNLSGDKYKNLYDFWTEKVTEQLDSEMTKTEILLNLARKEYGKVIDRKKLNRKVIDFDFYELKDGKLKTIVVYTKHARGLVVRYCAETKAKTLNDVKAFNYEGYRIDEEKSTDTNLVFTR